MTIPAYPLQWPAGWKRTAAYKRERGTFSVSLARARDGLIAEINRLGGRHIVLSSNLELRRDGLPYASQPALEDHGIAVYFDYKNRAMCFACDRYIRMEANMRAIELTISALRGIERWGASDMLERAFTGFIALPAPEVFEWWAELGLPRDASTADVEAAYRRLRSQHHPDKGGDSDAFQRIARAYDEATAP